MEIDSNKIHNEQDPFLREIWAQGYDQVIEDHPSHTLKLIRLKDKYVKIIPMIELTHNYTIKKVMLIDYTIHRWLAGSDGSCDKFIELIKPEI